MVTTYHVRVYRGPCSTVSTGGAPLAYPLADVTRPEENAADDPEVWRVGVATTSLSVALVDLLASRHVVAAFDEHENCVACGAIAGPVDQQGNLFIGLKESAASGYVGIAWFLDQGERAVIVTIFLVGGLSDIPAGTAEPESPAVPINSIITSSRFSNDEPQHSRLADAPTYCTYCGTLIPNMATFCPGCGRRRDTANVETSHATTDPRPSRWARLTDAVGTAGGIILAALGFIISMEVGSAVAFWTWRTFGPLSVIVTFEFWALVPFWYAWRWLIGHLTGWGWPV